MQHEEEIIAQLRMEPFTSSEIAELRHQILDEPRGVQRSWVVNNIQWLGIAAAITVAIIGVKNISNINPQRTPQTKTYTTQPGQRATITLADGSRVTLAPATKLSVTGRTVELDGEAMFTVSNDKQTPFIVRTSGIDTRVLGTVFGVRKYKNDKSVIVAVAEGKVAVRNAVLTNGDVAIADLTGSVRTTHDAERVAQALGWAQGRLVIDGVSFADAAADISRWYDVEVRLTTSASPDIASRTVILTLAGESPSQAFELLAQITHTNYTRTGRVVTFSPR